MATYARMIDGRIAQIISPKLDADGVEIPLEQRFDADVLAQLVEYRPRPQPEPGPPTFQERVDRLLLAIDTWLDAPAKAKGYDDIRSAALRAGYAGPFHDEGVAFAQWMDATYATCYQLLAQVQAGEIPEPDEAALLAMLPDPPSFD